LFEQKTDDERRTMMKKLMVLALVMGVAMLSNAALVVTAPDQVNVGEAFQIIIGGDEPYSFAGGLYGDGVTAVTGWSKVQGNVTGASFEAGLGGWEFLVDEVGATGSKPVPAGEWIKFDVLAPSVPGMLTFDLYDYNVDLNVPVKSFAVTVAPIIPEPATMLLLGLGGLLLRRK